MFSLIIILMVTVFISAMYFIQVRQNSHVIMEPLISLSDMP